MDVKEQAKKYFIKGDYIKALKIYNKLLASNNNDYIILANRSVIYIKIGEYQLALNDLINSIKIKSDWGKTWGRLGAALYGLDELNESLLAYNKANDLDNKEIYVKMINKISNELKGKNKQVNNTMGDLMNDEKFGQLFNNLINTVTKNKNLMDKFTNPEFQNKIMSLQDNPFSVINDREIMDIFNNLISNIKL
jgi:stress-induced-phosphoprotein 1